MYADLHWFGAAWHLHINKFYLVHALRLSLFSSTHSQTERKALLWGMGKERHIQHVCFQAQCTPCDV